MKIGLYPGSFDPFTYGHLDIVERARVLFDRLIVAIAHNSAKKSLFTIPERLDMIRSVLREVPGVEIVSFDGLLVDYARQSGASAIVRGIRAVTDFDYEYAIYQMNRDLNPEVDTIFLMAGKKYPFLSSTIIKEVARYGKSVEEYAPPSINEALLKKFGHIPD